MNIRTAVAGAGLALSLTAFVPLVHAQMGNPANPANPSSPGANPPGGYGAPGAGGGAPMNEGAGGTTGAQQRATQVANEIEAAKSQGKNVEGAQREQRLGERALKRGEEKTAMRHFTRAERALGMANGTRPRMENNGTTNPGASDNPSSRRDTANLRLAQAGAGGNGGGMGGVGGAGMGSGTAGGPVTGGTMGGAGTAGGDNGSGAATDGGSGSTMGADSGNGAVGTNGGSGTGAAAGGYGGGGMGAGGAGSGGMGGAGGAGGGDAGAP